ncbi:hypothetical protein KDJ56_11690 [Brevibacillus composti]|uniref:Uncharacterized protein n=1 Tax=Brevibacillus composti TaxID=2796470 RepID=A0A7T5EHG5_9BACL|nr:hypothetical protein [Brevibacillus composti]QQE72641.1 hypothetical protein JD108_11745 [Brevibacillus composti]QUO39719.1 hypothetical protein KDJ56_11690 [Brevibacillus composti]
MGNVDLSLLSWNVFWIGIAFFSVTGVLFCFGFLHLVQKKIKSGVLFMISSVISAYLFLSYLFTHHI